MVPFEFLTSIALGVITAVTLTSRFHWEAIGFTRAVALGGLAGIVRGLLGFAASTGGPTWGDMPYHPVTALFAAFGGASVVALLRVLMGDPAQAPSKVSRRAR